MGSDSRAPTAGPASGGDARFDPASGLPRRKTRRVSITAISSWAFTLIACAFVLSLIATFVIQSVPVWKQEGLDYLFGTRWFHREKIFETASMIYGTLVVAAVALFVAVPVGVGAAICASEFLGRRSRIALKIAMEWLAGVPSVIYGLLGVLFLREWVYEAFSRWDPLSGDTLLTAGLLLAIMVLPTLMSLSDDALRGVPLAQREAARGLGLSRAETARCVVLPQAWHGIAAAILLALGRALGEMIAVFLVVGRQDNQWPESFLRSLLEPGQTLSSKLGSAEIHIAYGDPLHWGAMVGLGVLMLAMVGAATGAAFHLLRKSSHA